MVFNHDVQKIIAKKTKLVAWIVSHCSPNSKRDHYVREMQKYIYVDIFGTCGPMHTQCTNNCEKMLDEEYKFYISFENTICK